MASDKGISWGGVFAPQLGKAKSPVEQNVFQGHGSTNPLITVGEPEYGSVQIYVQFDHVCHWNDGEETTPPSNAKTYTFDYELDEYTDGEQSAAADLQLELDKIHEQEKSMKWLQDNLDLGTITRLTETEVNGQTFWV